MHHTRKISVTALLLFLVVVYTGLGLMKLFGGAGMQSVVQRWSTSAEFTSVLGAIEIIAAICLFIPKMRIVAAIILVVDAFQAATVHLLLGDTKMTLPLLALTILTFLLAMMIMAGSAFQSPKIRV